MTTQRAAAKSTLDLGLTFPMSKYFGGFILGAITGALGMWLYTSNAVTPSTSEPPESRIASAPAPTIQAFDEPAAPSAPPPSESQQATITPKESTRRIEEHTSTISPAVTERAAPVVPVPLTEAHAALIKQSVRDASRGEPTIENYHRQLEEEQRDDGWAYSMEEHLRAYLAKQAPTPHFDIVEVQCRSTMCELQALAYSEGSGKEWNRIMAAMPQEPWWAFTGTSSSSSEENGYSVLLTILHKP